MDRKPVDVAILLAAGRGSRLAPYTDTIPKPLLPVKNRPTLDILLESVAAGGIRNIVLVTHYLSEQIEAFAEECSSRRTLNIRCVQQQELAGTADALECVLKQLSEPWLEGSFLLSATDYIVPQNFFPDLLDFHRSHNKQISISLKSLESEIAMRSSVRFDLEDGITEIVEKPAPGTAPSNVTANLTYVLPSGILRLLKNTPVSSRGERELPSVINQYLADHGPAAGLMQPVPAEWQPEIS